METVTQRTRVFVTCCAGVSLLVLACHIAGCASGEDKVQARPPSNEAQAPPVAQVLSPDGSAQTPSVAQAPGDPLDNLSSGEKERLQDIMRLLGNPEVPITLTLRKEFWGLLHKTGQLTPSQVAYFKDMMFGAATVYMRYFYEDALSAHKTRQPFKSLQRERYERRLLELGVMSEFRVEQNERLIEQIAAHQPVSTAQGDVVFDDATIRSILAGLDVAGQRVNQLFTRP